MKQTKKIMTILVAIMLSLVCFTGCAKTIPNESATPDSSTVLVEGGTLLLKVNPEFEINYDKDGLVTEVNAKNDDARTILATYTGFEGKPAKQVVSELVNAIGSAGYFVEDVDGNIHQITIEIETGSKLPNTAFLDEIVEEARNAVNTNTWTAPVDVRGESDFGITDYVDTDYGPNNDGFTDYNDTDYGPNNDGVTDYIDTDYGPNNDGFTDYNDTDYGPNNDGFTDYNDTDYGPNNDGVTDYHHTDYHNTTDYHQTDYHQTDYGKTDYHHTNYGDSKYD